MLLYPIILFETSDKIMSSLGCIGTSLTIVLTGNSLHASFKCASRLKFIGGLDFSDLLLSIVLTD